MTLSYSIPGALFVLMYTRTHLRMQKINYCWFEPIGRGVFEPLSRGVIFEEGRSAEHPICMRPLHEEVRQPSKELRKKNTLRDLGPKGFPFCHELPLTSQQSQTHKWIITLLCMTMLLAVLKTQSSLTLEANPWHTPWIHRPLPTVSECRSSVG